MFCIIMLSTMFSVIHNTDGGADDFATTAVIAAAQKQNIDAEEKSFDFASIVLTNGDSEPEPALSAYFKTIYYFGLEDKTRVGLSPSNPQTPFPWSWRMESEIIDDLPCFRKESFKDHYAKSFKTYYTVEDGDEILRYNLKHKKNVKIIATGPLSSIAAVLKQEPSLAQNISELHWMGGAIDVPGNIEGSPEIPQKLLNAKAEWNVFADPYAANWIFRNTHFDIYLYPIDISNNTYPIKFLEILNQKNETIYSIFVKECYQKVNDDTYRMWDVVAASGIFFPEVLEPATKQRLHVITDKQNQGTIVRANNGRAVYVYTRFKDDNVNLFYEAVANTLSQA